VRARPGERVAAEAENDGLPEAERSRLRCELVRDGTGPGCEACRLSAWVWGTEEDKLTDTSRRVHSERLDPQLDFGMWYDHPWAIGANQPGFALAA
jgi:hypothetical protein